MLFAISALLVIISFCLFGALSARQVKTAGEYAIAGRRAGVSSVAGILLGVLVAGGATIGTVQMAYRWGIAAWWFTLGSGIGCLLLSLRFARPARRSRLATLPGFLEQNYGYRVALLTFIGSILGTVISVAGQFLAGAALLCNAMPVSQETALFIFGVLVLSLIFSGGIKSLGATGNAKVALLYLTLVVCCVKAVSIGQTPGVLMNNLPSFPWFNLFARGVGKEFGACLSVLVGILCTQIYMQAIFSASDESTACRGCLVAAVLTPPLGVMAVWVGLALRGTGIEIDPAQALPYFLKAYFHPMIAGVFWAGLIIAVVGGAAGLSFGIATNLSFDIYLRFQKGDAENNTRKALLLSRFLVAVVVVLSAILSLALRNDLILELSYISMGLRGAGMVVPLIMAILYPGLLSPGEAYAASALGLGVTLATWAFVPSVEPLFVGLIASMVPVTIRMVFRRQR